MEMYNADGSRAQMCGNGIRCVAKYVVDRKQFDHPLGFFQAVKHPLVDAMVAIDRARSLLYHAACCVDLESPDALRAARMAKSAASDAGAFISDRSVQLHGGIGFTWECDVQIWFKRAMFDRAFLGAPSLHRERAAQLANW